MQVFNMITIKAKVVAFGIGAVLLLLLGACGGGAAPAGDGGVAVESGSVWVRPAVTTGMSDAAMGGNMDHSGGSMDHGSMGQGGGGNSAAYLRLVNTGGEADALVGASTDAAKIVEIHDMTMENGVMKMFPIEQIEIPAGGSAELQPGGLHVMLIDLNQDLNAGDEVELTLKLASGKEIQVTAPVEQR
ncbi:MAG: copper chaperone PCu(A)C [Chloroflexaceae bacterium]|nr:copper chaperone PCu(A)C [Chloroflexaceae bacterium]